MENRRLQLFDPSDNSHLLVTAGAGGAAIDLTGASKIIQYEPWWNGNDERQMHARYWRPAQDKQIYVYRLQGINSPIDLTIERTRDNKLDVNDAIMTLLLRSDGEESAKTKLKSEKFFLEI